jgi:hypothetical protein
VLPAAREYLADSSKATNRGPTITVATSMFGPRSGAMGAALVAFERLVKLGVLLPTFRDGERRPGHGSRGTSAGLDGVFAYDHLWPMGSRPRERHFAPFPVLAAVATSAPTSCARSPRRAHRHVSTLEQLVELFSTLSALAPGRVIAALGTGDELSKAEELAYDLGYPHVPTSVGRGCATWRLSCSRRRPCGSGRVPRRPTPLARELGATLNLWGADRRAGA